MSLTRTQVVLIVVLALLVATSLSFLTYLVWLQYAPQPSPVIGNIPLERVLQYVVVML